MSASTFAVSSPDGTDAVGALAGASPAPASVPALQMRGLVKAFDRKVAVDRLSLDIPVSSFYGIVGPNGAGKTTSLSMATGLLRPDAGQVLVHGVDVWTQPQRAKTLLGVLPDGLRTFDRLNGLELVTYSGLLRGLERDVVVPRATELVKVLGLWDAGTTLVADYSAGMRKKIHLACAMVHSPSILVLDEPFEAVDPISAQTIQAILRDYAAAGGTAGHLQPRHGHGAAPVRPRGHHQCRPGCRRRHDGAGRRRCGPRAALHRAGGGHVRTEGLSWLRPSSS